MFLKGKLLVPSCFVKAYKKNEKALSISRVLSPLSQAEDDHLSWTAITGSLGRLTRRGSRLLGGIGTGRSRLRSSSYLAFLHVEIAAFHPLPLSRQGLVSVALIRFANNDLTTR